MVAVSNSSKKRLKALKKCYKTVFQSYKLANYNSQNFQKCKDPAFTRILIFVWLRHNRTIIELHGANFNSGSWIGAHSNRNFMLKITILMILFEMWAALNANQISKVGKNVDFSVDLYRFQPLWLPYRIHQKSIWKHLRLDVRQNRPVPLCTMRQLQRVDVSDFGFIAIFG